MLTKLRETYNKSRISKNTAPKLLSLLCAAILWFYVMNQVNPEIIRELQNVPVKLIGIEDVKSNSLEIMGEVDYYVNVKIKGRRKEAFNVTSDNIEVVADLRGYDKGMNNVPLRKSINAENISIVELSRPDIKVFLDQIVEVPKTVSIAIVGEVPNGYISDELQLQPEVVTVKGPESIVNNVKELYGELIIGDGTNSVMKEIPIIPHNSDGEIVSGVTIKSDYIKAVYVIRKRKSVPLFQTIVGNVANGYKLINTTITPNTIIIDGEKAIVNSTLSMKTNNISIDELSSNFKVEVQLVPVDGIMTPFLNNNVVVEGIIEEIISKEFTVNIKDIPMINLNTDYETDIATIDESVVVRIYDAGSILETVKKSDIELIIDASELVVGENEVELKINANGDFESVQIIPNKVIINIRDTNIDETIPAE